MPIVNYKLIQNMARVDDQTLVLDFAEVDFLNTFEIAELFSYLQNTYEELDHISLANENQVSNYLKRINFYTELEKAYQVPQKFKQSDLTGNNPALIELKLHEEKSSFTAQTEQLFEILATTGLSQDSCSLIVASLSEVIDNAFSHNLGNWPSSFYKRVLSLTQTFPKKKEIWISVADLGVGFKSTLENRYADVKDERSAIEIALKPNTTSRPSGQGGNGLIYLQKNIFNGLRGDLYIRSTNTLLEVVGRGTCQEAGNDLPYQYGANVFFKLRYE